VVLEPRYFLCFQRVEKELETLKQETTGYKSTVQHLSSENNDGITRFNLEVVRLGEAAASFEKEKENLMKQDVDLAKLVRSSASCHCVTQPN